MADATDFLDEENWHGGYYELAIVLGARSDPSSDSRLAAALTAVWAGDDIDGGYLNRRASPSDQQLVEIASINLEEPPSLKGVATLPTGRQLVCASHAIRETEDAGQTAHDWLDLCLPLGALGRTDHRVGGYPFEPDDTSSFWKAPVDGFLIDAARRVADVVSFKLALIGFEVSGSPAADDFTGLPPDERWITYIVRRPAGIEVFPANR